MVYARSRTVQENETHKILWNFEIQTDYLFPARIQDLVLIKKKRTYNLEDFVILADQRVKIKEKEKIDKY